MSWVENDIATAREGLRVMKRNEGGDPEGRMSAQLVERGAEPMPHDPLLGYVANIIRNEPGIVQRIRDEGFAARVTGTVALDRNPYHRDGERGWWRQGWLTADDNLGDC
jgi:hypothetical protein